MLVPKKPDGFCFRMTMSCGDGPISATISLPSRLVETFGFSAPRAFFQPHEPASHASSRKGWPWSRSRTAD